MNQHSSAPSVAITTRSARAEDVAALTALEKLCFTSDRLSARRFRHYITAPHAELVVACADDELLGYALLLVRRATLLTRLYSIAVAPAARGTGTASVLIGELEKRALARGKPFMRLEVAQNNVKAIALYQRLGFQPFGLYPNYYADHTDAVRMQKRLHRKSQNAVLEAFPWYRQTTEFTCGPAALMMALCYLRSDFAMDQRQELAIWRQATTIFMTSGHGGCHPVGLALAAADYGFEARVWLNGQLPLFTESVRSSSKKAIIRQVEADFGYHAQQSGISLAPINWSIEDLAAALAAGEAVVCLISTWQLDQRKAPHWVVVTGIDANCVYIHDPDPGDDEHLLDFQHVPIARDDFLRLACYGRKKLRAAIIVSLREAPAP